MDKKEVLEQLIKGLRVIKEDLSKGDVIPLKPKEMGKTKSGKTVYYKDHPSHESFTAEEHAEASRMHGEAAKKLKTHKDMGGGFKDSGKVADKDKAAYEHHGERLNYHADKSKAMKQRDLKKGLNEITAKVNTPKAMQGLKTKAAKNLAAKPPQLQHQPPPSNEITKKVVKAQNDEKTAEETAGKTVEKISQGSKTTSDAAKNLMDKDNYPKHTQESAKKKGLNPFLLARKNMKKKMDDSNGC